MPINEPMPHADEPPPSETGDDAPATAASTPNKPAIAKFKCMVCEAKFPKKNAIVAHIKTHLGKKKYICKTLGWYVNSYYLGEYPSTKLAFSNMAFVREHDCKRHEATHTGTRPHICVW